MRLDFGGVSIDDDERLISVDAADITTIRPGSRDGTPRELTDAVGYLLDRYELTSGAPLPQTIAVVAPAGGEGVTTVSRSLAETLSSSNGANVCRIDMAVSSPSPASPPRRNRNRPDRAERVSRRRDGPTEPQVSPESAPTTNGEQHVSIEPHHVSANRPHLVDVFQRLTMEYDHLVLDLPPLLPHNATLGLLRHADAYLLVVRHGVTTLQQIEAVTEDLSTIPCLGIALNRHRISTPRSIRRLLSE